MSADKTNLTELAGLFPSTDKPEQPRYHTVVSPRFWRPGDTYEQALARQQESLDQLRAKMRSKQ